MSNSRGAWADLKDAVRPLVPPSLWQALRLVKIRLAKRMFKPYVTTQRFGEVELSLRISDPMAREWYLSLIHI